MSFVHLHLHTESSWDAITSPAAAAKAAAADGQPAMAILDHGTLAGVPDFVKACTKVGVRPIVGVELYHVEDVARAPARGDRDEVNDTGRLNHHLPVIAETEEGWRNLVKLCSRAESEGKWSRYPRVDWAMLADHAAGLRPLTGCLGGWVPQALLRGDYAGADAAMGKLVDIFGEPLVELQDHGIPDQLRILPDLIGLARRFGVDVVATNDSHYTAHADCGTHDAYLADRTKEPIGKPGRFRFHGDQHYIKTAGEMAETFAIVEPSAVRNTLAAAERCTFVPDFSGAAFHLPRFPWTDGLSERAYLRRVTLAGAKDRYGDLRSRLDVVRRIDYELGVIAANGIADYSAFFLIYWRLFARCRDEGILCGPGRGSVAGSVVAYCLRITDVDPIRYGLPFERFLNPSRVSPPDIDADFDTRRRDRVVEMLREDYGAESVASIATVGRIKARAAVRAAARVLDQPVWLADKLSKAMPPLIAGRDTPIRACLDKVEGHEAGYAMASGLRALATDATAAEVLELAARLEGIANVDGVHASAKLLTPGPVSDIAPTKKVDGVLVTQWTMKAVEDVGGLKMDVLGLRNLDMIADACAAAGISPDDIPLDDPRAYELISRGDTTAVFQLESPPMRDLCRRVRPERIEEVADLLALYRPGPMASGMHLAYARRKWGLEQPDPFHPAAGPALAGTYGLMFYQETLMAVAQLMAGLSLADADLLRKATGKKIPEAMRAERAKFVEGCVATSGLSEGEAGRVFDEVFVPFADYSFSKNHSLPYAAIAVRTAWLKAVHPAVFLAAAIQSVVSDSATAGIFIRDARSSGLAVTAPCVNRSGVECVGSGDVISLGLGLVRGLGSESAQAIVAERCERGEFASLADWCDRAGGLVGADVHRNLAAAGAFDIFGHTRAGIAKVLTAQLDLSAGGRRTAGALSLLGDMAAPAVEVPTIEDDRAAKLAAERDMLGVHVSGHPLDDLADVVESWSDAPLSSLTPLGDGAPVRVCGLVASAAKGTTKKGAAKVEVLLEDLHGSVKVMLSGRSLDRCDMDALTVGAVTVIEGSLRVEEQDDQSLSCSVFGSSARLMPHEPAPALRIAVDDDVTYEQFDALRQVIMRRRGAARVEITAAGRRVRLAERVELGEAIERDIRSILGPEALSGLFPR